MMATRFLVLDAATTEGFATWRALWRAWPGREIFAHPEYVRLFAGPSDRTVCAIGEYERATILFPLVLRPLAAEPWSRPGERRWDATTPYGYGGRSPGDGGRETTPRSGARTRNGATTNGSYRRSLVFPCSPSRSRPCRRLRKFARPMWCARSPGASTRSGRTTTTRSEPTCRAAERAGAQVEIDRTSARLDAFLSIYEHTMRRRNAAAFHFFPRAFFEQIAERLAGHFAFVHALALREVVSSELVLCSEERVYPFLGGTQAEAFRIRPNDMLRHRTIAWAIAEGKKAYVLRGRHRAGGRDLPTQARLRPAGRRPFRGSVPGPRRRGVPGPPARPAMRRGGRNALGTVPRLLPTLSRMIPEIPSPGTTLETLDGEDARISTARNPSNRLPPVTVTRRLIVYGAGGHGKVVADIGRSMGFAIAAFVDDDAPKIGTTFFGVPVLSWERLIRERETWAHAVMGLGIGDNAVRERCFRRICAATAADGHR